MSKFREWKYHYCSFDSHSNLSTFFMKIYNFRNILTSNLDNRAEKKSGFSLVAWGTIVFNDLLCVTKWQSIFQKSVQIFQIFFCCCDRCLHSYLSSVRFVALTNTFHSQQYAHKWVICLTIKVDNLSFELIFLHTSRTLFLLFALNDFL